MEEERHETFEHLVGPVGMTVDEAERVMRDDDLWLVPPKLRLDLPDEEAVEEWRKAGDALADLVHVANNINLGTMVAVMDAQYRVGVALERARERVKRAREEG